MRLVKLSELREYEVVYLATPYTEFKFGLDEAFIQAAKLSARLAKKGINVYSPIVFTHPMAIHGGIEPKDHGFWIPFDSAMMRKSDALLIGKLDGWEVSQGIAIERKKFSTAKKPIYFLDPIDLGVTQQ